MLVSYANAVYGVSSLIIYVVVPSALFRFTRTCFHPCFGKKKKRVLASPCSHLLMTNVPRHIFSQQGTWPNDFFSCHFYQQLHSWSFFILLIFFTLLWFFSLINNRCWHSSLVFWTFPDLLEVGKYYLKSSSELWNLPVTFYLGLCRWSIALFTSQLRGFPSLLWRGIFSHLNKLSHSVFSSFLLMEHSAAFCLKETTEAPPSWGSGLALPLPALLV